MTLLVVLLPLSGVRLWVDLTSFSRWAYTDLVFAIVMFVTALWMLCARVQPRVLVYLIAASAVVLMGGECYYVAYAVDSPESDNYLSSAIQILGYLAVCVAAAGGLIASLFTRKQNPHPSASPRER